MILIFNSELETNFKDIMVMLYEKQEIDNNILILGDFNTHFLNAFQKFNIYTNKSLSNYNINNQELIKNDLIFSDKPFEEIFNNIKFLLKETTYIKVKHLTDTTIIDTPKFIKNKLQDEIPIYSFNSLQTDLIPDNIKSILKDIKVENLTLSSESQDYRVSLINSFSEDIKTLEEFKSRYLIGRYKSIKYLTIPNTENLKMSKNINKVTNLFLPNNLIFSDLSYEDILDNINYNININSSINTIPDTNITSDINSDININILILINNLITENLKVIIVEDIKTKNLLTTIFGLSKTMIKTL